MTKVINLTPWAGPEFSCAPGDEIELAHAVAEARIAAGLCAAIPTPKKAPEPKLADVKPEAKPAEAKA